ncbi:MAG: hypothetical protein FWD23_07775 [Oscillospiraceae bacterium]|nr:hypothetical protein [Oscillospiraceae bacterium]
MSKKAISLIIAAVLAASVLFSCKTTYDYVKTVQDSNLLQEMGFTQSSVTVTDKYVTSSEWKNRTEGGTEYVDLKGKIKGSGEDIVMTFKVTPIEGEEGMFYIQTHSLELDGETKGADEAAVLLYYMYAAYDGGFDLVDIDEFLNFEAE